MENKIAIISIIIRDTNAIVKVNALLHDYAEFIIGRMGIPYRQKNIQIISVFLDAPSNDINSLSGKLGRISGVKAKTVQSDLQEG